MTYKRLLAVAARVIEGYFLLRRESVNVTMETCFDRHESQAVLSGIMRNGSSQSDPLLSPRSQALFTNTGLRGGRLLSALFTPVIKSTFHYLTEKVCCEHSGNDYVKLNRFKLKQPLL